MSAMLLLQSQQIYNSISLNKSKEKINMVLEPLQAMIQLSLLSVSPIGTKLTIHQNILYIQNPSITQPITRWFNADKKDDLFFLFQVVKRFIKWYNINLTKSKINKKLYDLLINMAIIGFDNLIKTYQNSENIIIIQVFNMYKNILQNNEASEISKIENSEIDEIFQNIVEIYNEEILNIIYSTLILIQKESQPIKINYYITGLNSLLTNHNNDIHQWILDKLAL
jgi:hypothetical protein